MNKWDEDYLALAEFWATRRSKDPSTQTGAVIVRPDNTIVSLGYNGFPKGIEDTQDRYNDRETKYELIVHCEMNAIINTKESVQGCTLYTWPFLSCTRCAVHMIQAGITRAVAPKLPEHLKERWEDSINRTKALFAEAGVEVVEV